MSDNLFRGRHEQRPGPPRARAVTALIAMAGIALVAAACGGGGGSSAGASATNGSARYQRGLVYAQCMRAHGVPNFPDPNSQGQFPPVQEGGNGVTMQVVQSAQTACRHLRPFGGQGTAQQQARQTQALNFAKCMRAHGVPNFPDPTAVSGGGMGFNMSGIDTHSPQFQSAQQVCQLRNGQGSK